MKAPFALALAATAAVAATQAAAQDPVTYGPQRSWNYELQLYLWGTEVGGEAAGEDFELGFDEILENLNFALMGALRGYNGPWMTYGELSYASVRQDGDATFTVAPGGLGGGFDVDAVADAEIETTIVSFGGGYRLVDTPTYSMYGLFGARYLSLNADLTLDLTGPLGNKVSRDVDGDQDYWDAVVGVNGRAAFNDNWFMTYLADIGAGESDLTWQAGLGVGYTWGRNDIVLGYRHMEWDLPDDDLVTEYYQTGPMLLWNFRF
jgi:hypothetical protein